jgi:hypothetical protein
MSDALQKLLTFLRLDVDGKLWKTTFFLQKAHERSLLFEHVVQTIF